VSIPATLDTEHLYTPASLSARLLISSCDLPVLLMILLPSPRINTLPFFCQSTIGGGVPMKEHTRTKWSPSVWFIGAGRSTMKGRAVWQTCLCVVNSTCVYVWGWCPHLMFSLAGPMRPESYRPHCLQSTGTCQCPPLLGWRWTAQRHLERSCWWRSHHLHWAVLHCGTRWQRV